ncbi:hypothetical protein L1987_81650 [Smallanthus sonchifolius]|uniref:Uncharacterized protein n=1 Tax=Smallanthus sonchifolius TaxID=185202 RepID=A0ACB8YS97_9ASTR|nr:hypothetical protein L1987_81650 [Smallanthus sonchifolius]
MLSCSVIFSSCTMAAGRMAKQGQTFFLEEWLKKNSDAINNTNVKQSTSQSARAIVQAWADLRESLNRKSFSQQHYRSLQTLLYYGISLYVVDPQVKLLISILSASYISLPSKSYVLFHKPLYSSQSTSKGSATMKAVTVAEPVVRRSANYGPSLWSFDEIQSLSSEYTGEDYKARANTLKDAAKKMIRNVESPLINTLELVDDLQRLGISYHFEDEIRNLVEVVYNNYYKTLDKWNRMDLNLKALGFRLLRQHGYQVPQELFHNFKDKTQNLKPHSLNDMMGMLNFKHALELRLHWRVSRVKSKWFIEVYEKRSDMNPTLLELAKLDFNMVQTVLGDLKHVSSLGRSSLTKAVAMITAIDDVYDVYGTLDELEKITDIIDRWDINAMEELPDYMKICFLGFYNTINEISYNTLTNTEILILPYLKKAWADLCKVVEARWYYSGYTPTLQEFLDNGYVSVSGPVVLMHAKFATSVGATEEILERMAELENIEHYSSLILRLADDLGTSTDELARGDIPKSVQCYMHESGATEEEARGYIKEMIRDAWKKLNKERALANSQFSREYIEYATNMARMAQFMYGEGDGHGRPEITKSHLSSLLFNPIQGTK